jgi:hypothetical protein
MLRQHISTQANYTLSYPFNEKCRMTLNAGGREEYNTVKASETQTLNIPDVIQYFYTGRAEFIYDNTVSLGLNMMSGLRLSAGLDMMNQTKSNLQVSNLFADFRYYLPVYRKIIFANRFTGAYSLGNAQVAYYLGAVENWTVKDQFGPNTRSLSGNEYLFQHWVCNLRGFSRGVRMGSNFMLLNSELRIPVVQTLITKPIDLTFTGFADAGTAFIGRSPSDPENPFNTVQFSTPNYDISITSQRNPYVLGLGYGVRTRFLGYFVKYDHAWGYIEKTWQKPMNYLSIGFDF